jgi:hypothetical protein
MKTPALAIGWTIWRRHRWGLSAAAVCVVVVVLACSVGRAVLGPGEALQLCGEAAVPLAVCALYLVAVFAYGFDSDLATAGTAFPSRMFTLPVRTAALAGWPMAYGAAAVGSLWLITASLIFRPAGLDVPLWWPALLAAAQLAWMQALAWWPFGLAWLRIVVALLVAHLPITGTMLALRLDVPEWVVSALLVVVLSAGLVAAWAGVARARSGDVASWRWLTNVGTSFDRGPAPRTRFRSAAQALAWFELRRHGLALPLIVATVVPLCLLSFFLEEITPSILVRNLGLVLLVPVFFAAMASGSVGRNNQWVREHYGISSFAATRPVTTAALVAAKLRAAGRTTLVTWGLTLGLVAAAIVTSGANQVLGTMLDAWLDARPAAEVIATVIVAAVLLVLFTWKRIVESLLVGLTGREWLIKAAVVVWLFVGFNVAILFLWLLINTEYQDTLRRGMPWVMAVLASLKLGLGAVAIGALRRNRLVPDRTLFGLGAAWLVTFAILVGVLAWLIPAQIVPVYTVGLGVLLMMPFARFAAMPLALDWNRHR